jgi:hypothetical protein
MAGLVFLLVFWVLAGACQRHGVGVFFVQFTIAALAAPACSASLTCAQRKILFAFFVAHFLFKWTNGRMSPIPSNPNARAVLSHGAVLRRTFSSGSKSRQTIHRCCNIKRLNSGTTQRPTSPNVDEPPLVKIIHRADADGSAPNARPPPGQPLRASMTAGNRTVARAKRCGRGDTDVHHTR